MKIQDVTKNAPLLLCGIAVVILGLIFSFGYMSFEAESPTETAQAEPANFSENGNSSRTRNGRLSGNSGTPEKNRVGQNQSTGTLQGFSEGKNGDMLRAAGNFQIKGYVVNHRGEAVAGATICLLPYDQGDNPTVLRTTTSDANGTFVLDKIDDSKGNQYTVIATAPGYAPDESGYAGHQSVELRLTLRPGSTVKGMVVDAITSQPLAGAKVFYKHIYPPIQMTTGPDGLFQFENAPNYITMIFAQKDGYILQDSDSSLTRKVNRHSYKGPRSLLVKSDGSTSEMLPNVNFDYFILPLVPGGCSVRGIVVDAGNKPVAGAKVRLQPKFWEGGNGRFYKLIGPTKEDGAFEFKNLSPIQFELSAIKGMEGEKVVVDFGLNANQEGIKLTVPTTVMVHGKVVEVGNHKPVPGTKIGYDSYAGRKDVISDDKGEFFFRTMAIDNSYTIYVEAEGIAPTETEDVSTTQVARTIVRKLPKGAGSDDVTIKLVSTPSISGKVLGMLPYGDGGAPRRNVTVKAIHQVEGGKTYTEETRTNDSGDYYFNLPLKSNGLRSIVMAKGFNSEDAQTVTRKEKQTIVNLSMGQSAFQGILVLSDNSPLRGVPVRLTYIDSQSDLKLFSDKKNTYENGSFFFSIGKDMDAVLTFQMPGGQVLEQMINGNKSKGTKTTFVYDPTNKSMNATTAVIPKRDNSKVYLLAD